MPTDSPAFLIALPGGLMAGGVATWAVRLANGLSARGARVGLLLHASRQGHRPLAMPLAPGVMVADLTNFPPLEDAAAVLPAFRDRYLEAAEVLAGDGPLVLSPNQHGDCYGLAAALTQLRPRTHVVGWLHNDLPYEYHVQRHYEPVIARFVPVSRRLAEGCADCLPSRAADIRRIAHGVEVPPLPARRPLAGRPIRLVYAGRLEHEQKRVLALLHMADALRDAGVAHELVLAGDGPAAAEVRAAAATRPSVTILGAIPPARVLDLLAAADIAVLASRYEGLSVSVIEALSRGCVPVVTRTASGAAELVEDGISGVLVDAGPERTDRDVGVAMAQGVRRAIPLLPTLALGAHARAAAHHSTRAHLNAVQDVLAEIIQEPARTWPAARPWAFSGDGRGPSGAVPDDAARLLSQLLSSLAGRRIIIHGAGRHTQELASVFRAAPCTIAAIADDNPATHGQEQWGVPVLSPAAAARTGATDVVISSWINQDAIWDRRGEYERAGLAVHRIYAPALTH